MTNSVRLISTVSTYLEHIRAHGVVQFVLKRLVFEIEFNVVVTVIMLDNVEDNAYSGLWDWFSLTRLREFDFVPSFI